MTSLFEVRSKTISADDLTLSFLNFIKSAKRLQAMKHPMRRAKPANNATEPLEHDQRSAIVLPKLVMFELEIFSGSIERNALRERNASANSQFTRIFKAFHSKRKQVQQTFRLKSIYREKCEGMEAECRRVELGN